MSKQSSSVHKKEKVKKKGITFLMVLVGIGEVIAVLAVLFVIVFVLAGVLQPKPDAHDVLRQNIDSFEYFLDGREIVEYEFDRGFQYSMYRIKTSVALDKVAELLGVQVLIDCQKEDFKCDEPPWPENAKTSPGKYCTSAIDPIYDSRKTEICIDTKTGEFTFYRQRG